MSKSSKIFITGDIHRTNDISKLVNFTIDQKSLTKNDYLIVAGDFGALWHGYKSSQDEQVLNLYKEQFPWTTLWIDGNHENFDQIEQYKKEKWNGGYVHKINDSVIHLMRGQVYTINNLKFFTMGGGVSIDKEYRIPGLSWWPQEMPSSKEYDEALKNLRKNNLEVDYIVTHSCPYSYLKKTFSDTYYKTEFKDELNYWLDYIDTDLKVKYKHWYYGHYHLDKEVDDKHTALYNEIVQIQTK